MIELRHNAAELLMDWRKRPERTRLAIERGLGRACILVEQRVRQNADLKFSGGRSGLIPRLNHYIDRRGENLNAAIGFLKTKGFPYELSQEFGAKAKPGGAMAIPVTSEARALSQRGQGPRDFPRKLFLPPGSHILAEANGKTSLTVQYVLVKSIKPRLNFMKTVAASAELISNEIEQEYRKAL